MDVKVALSIERQEPTRLKIARLLSPKDELAIMPNLTGRRLMEEAYLAVAEVGESNLDTGPWRELGPEVEVKAANDLPYDVVDSRRVERLDAWKHLVWCYLAARKPKSCFFMVA